MDLSIPMIKRTHLLLRNFDPDPDDTSDFGLYSISSNDAYMYRPWTISRMMFSFPPLEERRVSSRGRSFESIINTHRFLQDKTWIGHQGGRLYELKITNFKKDDLMKLSNCIWLPWDGWILSDMSCILLGYSQRMLRARIDDIL